jgi:hypothetical protein
MNISPRPLEHPLLAVVRVVEEALDETSSVDPMCRADGCDIPAAWCEAHHADKPWSQGGKTDLKHGLLLCSFHHHRAHDHRYDGRRLPDDDVRSTRRT